MKLLLLILGKTVKNSNGDIIRFLEKRTSNTFPFFPEFDIYRISVNGKSVSVTKQSLKDFLKGKPLSIIL